MPSKYLDRGGRYRTSSLFSDEIKQHVADAGYEPVWSFRGRDDSGLECFKDIYMSYSDPTEYQFAMDTLGDWKHWEYLQTLQWFMKELSQWREEMEVKLRSMAIQSMIVTAATEGSKGTTAAKWLATKGWTDEGKGRGRPSKEEVERERKIQARIKDDLKEDATRLGLGTKH